MKVTAPEGDYPNTTGHLFINTDEDTGNVGSDTLTASSAAACIPGQTLANWTVPVDTTADPPDLAGGVPAIKASDVSTATASALYPTTQISSLPAVPMTLLRGQLGDILDLVNT